MNPIQNLLTHQRVIVIDGALGTELERKGCDLNDALWSSKVLIDNPNIIKEIHLSYLEAGADCITAAAVIQIMGVAMGMWSLGYGVGQAVAWTRKIRDAI